MKWITTVREKVGVDNFCFAELWGLCVTIPRVVRSTFLSYGTAK